MADKDKKKDDVVDEKPSTPPAKVVDKVIEQETTAVAAEPTAAPVLLSFDRWFATLDKPEHHKAGMKAYANTSGKKSLEQWASIFKAY